MSLQAQNLFLIIVSVVISFRLLFKSRILQDDANCCSSIHLRSFGVAAALKRKDGVGSGTAALRLPPLPFLPASTRRSLCSSLEYGKARSSAERMNNCQSSRLRGRNKHAKQRIEYRKHMEKQDRTRRKTNSIFEKSPFRSPFRGTLQSRTCGRKTYNVMPKPLPDYMKMLECSPMRRLHP